MYLKKLISKTGLLLFMAATSMLSFAQGRSVSGVVTDVSGESMISVTVQEKGVLANGTITNLDGRYSLSNLSENSVLVFSYVGYITQEIKVDNRTTIDVVMQEDQQALDEVVVVGYGTVKRRDLTGSVASITGEKLEANPVTNVMQALQGQLPGVNVISQDGRPGATMQIRVRGGGSITQSNEPLIIVDGSPVSSIDDIPAANIETIDVLKDGATTAIYGARGANGVILVTTKGAKEGKPQVKYGVYFQSKQNAKTLEVLDAYDYVLWNWSYATSYNPADGPNIAKYFGLGSLNGNHLNDYRNVEAHNYINDLMRTAISWNHDLSLSGGNANTKYFAAFNYSDDEGIRVKSDFKRYNASFKVDQKISKTLSFSTDLRYSQIFIDGTQYGMATSVYAYRPIDNPLGDGNPGHFGTGSVNVETDRNPMYAIDNYTNHNKRQRLNARGTLTWDIIKGLKGTSEIAIRKAWGETKAWDSGNPVVSSSNRATLTRSEGHDLRWTSTLNYELQGLGPDHTASVMLGNEILSEDNSASTQIDAYGFPTGFTMDNAFGMIQINGYVPSTAANTRFSNTYSTPANTWSMFGRINYAYKGRYLLTLTHRNDHSSKFAPNHRSGHFPSAAGAWRISDEGFMEGTQNWLSNLKLRLSYGTTGADNIGPGLWKETWRISTITVDGKQITTYVPGEMLENPSLKWETTISRNLGLDFGILKNGRIHGAIDAYWNTTKDNLMRMPVDPTSGSSYQTQNVAQVSNKGVELTVGGDLFRNKDWRIGVNLTYNYNLNNVDEIGEDVLADVRMGGWGSTMSKPAYHYIVRKGSPVGTIQGFKANGWYTPDDFNYDDATGVYTLKPGVPDTKDIINYSSGVQNGFKRPAGQTAFPGMVKFKDRAGSATDADGKAIIDDDDKMILGSAMAPHTGGFNITAGYKGFDLFAGFIYQVGGNIFNANGLISMMGNKYDGMGNNRLAFVSETYKVYDVDNSGDIVLVTEPDALNALNVNAKYPLNFNEYGIVSSQFIEDASYLRLQNLTLGYTLPKQVLAKIGLQNVRLYATGTNLLLFKKYSGLDPDVNTQPGGQDGFATPNYDQNSYPKARSFTFGLNLTF
jgi:TonB-linked SusC/RagA family outer membrane protein